MNMSAWHTVRFVDEAEMPHAPDYIDPSFWKKVKGIPVKIGCMAGRKDIKVIPKSCDCEQFFEVDSEIFCAESPYGTPIVCRRMLDMD